MKKRKPYEPPRMREAVQMQTCHLLVASAPNNTPTINPSSVERSGYGTQFDLDHSIDRNGYGDAIDLDL